MNLGDETLARQAADGDGDALEVLLGRTYERLHGFCWRLVGPPPDSEDLCQDVCVKIASSLSGFHGRSRFTTWAYTIALNLARDMGRKAARQGALMDTYVAAEAAMQADAADDQARADWLRAAIWNLKDDLRETLVLIVEEGMSHAQAADILGVKEGTVSWRLNQARQALKTFATNSQEEV